MTIIHLIFFILGLILLVKGSEFFVLASSRIAKKLGVSEFVIGLTLVAVGTSLPELATSIIASIQNQVEIRTYVIGSNIANIGWVLGLSALFAVIKVKKTMLRRDGFVMLFSAIIFYLFALNGLISRIDGVLFLVVYTAYSVFIIKYDKTRKTYNFKDFLDYFLYFRYLNIKSPKHKASLKKRKKLHIKKELIKDFLIIIISLISLVYGANLLISETVWFAKFLGISASLIALTIMAIGTSLPELGVSLSAARKGFGDMAIGNIIGSSITNILLILGISSLIRPIFISNVTLFYTAPFMIFISLMMLGFMRIKWQLGKIKGILLILTYIIFIFLLYFILSS